MQFCIISRAMSEFIRKATAHMAARQLDESGLAREIGVPPSHVNRWLAGKTRPHGRNLVRVMNAIPGLTLEDVFPDVPSAVEPKAAVG